MKMASKGGRKGDPRAVRVAIADDHPLVRGGIRNALSGFEGIEVVAEASDGKAALEAAAGADVLLLDLSMPGMDGMEVLGRLAGSRARVVVLTSSQDPEALASALDAGAVSVLMKDVSGDALAEAVIKASRGERHWDASSSPLIEKALRSRSERRAGPFDALSPREREVALLMARGLTNAEIAEKLFLSVKTVKIHASNILVKTGASDRTKLAVLAWENGLALERGIPR
jgi:DNA-binding NarL/FixJ family response regulator